MHERSSPAFRTAVLSTILFAACNDAAVAPRPVPLQSAHVAGSPADVQVFVGRRADSVAHVYDAIWARSSRPEYREARHAWRKSNGFPDSIGDPGITPVGFVPNALLTPGDDGTLRPPPQIISHLEALHFGHGTGYLSVPDAIEAQVTFIGDQAEISAVNVTITSKTGSNYPLNGTMARGPGQLINCTDVVLGTCDNQRLLNALAVLPNAPTCDASGSGTVSYYASNLNSTLSGSTGSQTSVTASGSVSASASACPVTPDTSGQKTSDSTTTPTGTPSTPPPPPSGPNVPTAPPPPVPVIGGGSTVGFHCERGDIYVNGTLFETKITCYPDEARRQAESSHVF